jgi:hypothetical protein
MRERFRKIGVTGKAKNIWARIKTDESGSIQIIWPLPTLIVRVAVMRG